MAYYRRMTRPLFAEPLFAERPRYRLALLQAVCDLRPFTLRVLAQANQQTARQKGIQARAVKAHTGAIFDRLRGRAGA